MTPDLSCYHWEGARERESSARIINGMKQKKKRYPCATTGSEHERESSARIINWINQKKKRVTLASGSNTVMRAEGISPYYSLSRNTMREFRTEGRDRNRKLALRRLKTASSAIIEL